MEHVYLVGERRGYLSFISIEVKFLFISIKINLNLWNISIKQDIMKPSNNLYHQTDDSIIIEADIKILN